MASDLLEQLTMRLEVDVARLRDRALCGLSEAGSSCRETWPGRAIAHRRFVDRRILSQSLANHKHWSVDE